MTGRLLPLLVVLFETPLERPGRIDGGGGWLGEVCMGRRQTGE